MSVSDSIIDSPELLFMAFVEGQTDSVVSEFDDEGMRTVKSATFEVIGLLSIPPIDEVRLEVWETENDNDTDDQDKLLLTEDAHNELDADLETQVRPTNIDDGFVLHTLTAMFGDETMIQIRTSGKGLMASTAEGFDTMQPEAVPLFAQRTIEAFLEMKQKGFLVRK